LVFDILPVGTDADIGIDHSVNFEMIYKTLN